MTGTPAEFGLLGSILALVVAALVLLLSEAREKDVVNRLNDLMQTSTPGAPASSTMRSRTNILLEGVRRIGRFLQRKTKLFSEQELATFEQSLAFAGMDSRRNLPLLLGAKAVLTIVVPLLAYGLALVLKESPRIQMVFVAVGFILGLRGAFIFVRLLRKPFANAVRRGIPDAFDLLVICSEAGLGLESGLERVAAIMWQTNPPTAIQLAKLAEELRVMPDRNKVLANFGKNSGVEGLQRFTAILAQSLQFGSPLSQALRLVAAELRRQRINLLEERASRLPVLLIFPLMLFIMPCIMIVMVGPSMITLFAALRHM